MPQELRPRVIPIPYRKFFWELHISETILSILTKLCPNVPWVILFQSYVRYVWGPKKGPRGGLKFIFCPLKLMISWIVFILHTHVGKYFQSIIHAWLVYSLVSYLFIKQDQMILTCNSAVASLMLSRFSSVLEADSFLAHLTQRVMWGIAITWRPSSFR